MTTARRRHQPYQIGRGPKFARRLRTEALFSKRRLRRSEPLQLYEALRASSLSMRSLSKPTIHLLPTLITGTPVCPVLRTMSRAASGSRSIFVDF
jgi:hypothetical protein